MTSFFLRTCLTFWTRSWASWEMWTSPSTPGATSTKAPKSAELLHGAGELRAFLDLLHLRDRGVGHDLLAPEPDLGLLAAVVDLEDLDLDLVPDLDTSRI